VLIISTFTTNWALGLSIIFSFWARFIYDFCFCARFIHDYCFLLLVISTITAFLY